MSGPVSLLQGLCIFPRDVQFASNTLTRITEAWLVGENASDGPTAVHMNGLWIGLGLRGNLNSFQVGFGTRNGTLPTWVTPSGHDDVEKALRKAFGQNTANWKGFHLQLSDLPSSGPTWNALYFKLSSVFPPNKARDFHVVPIVVALAGGDEDTFGDSHYLLGLTVHTQSSGVVEDFMVVTQAMHHSNGQPGHPAVDVPAYPPSARPKKYGGSKQRRRGSPPAKRPKSRAAKSRPRSQRKRRR